MNVISEILFRMTSHLDCINVEGNSLQSLIRKTLLGEPNNQGWYFTVIMFLQCKLIQHFKVNQFGRSSDVIKRIFLIC